MHMNQRSSPSSSFFDYLNHEIIVVYDSKHSMEIRAHLDKYLKLAHELFRSGDYGLAVFFAVTLIEECGKLVLIAHTDEKYLDLVFKRGFFKHSVKYLEAIFVGWMYSAVKDDAVYAKESDEHSEQEDRLMQYMETCLTQGKLSSLFDARNSGLYLDFDRAKLEFVTPNQAISKVRAHSIICLAGELYAFIQGSYCGVFQGIPPDNDENHERLIWQAVDEFREQQ